MRIEQDLKLDFEDVLIRPKRSVLSSRKEVQLERDFVFRNSGRTYHGIPIIAANMDSVGTFEMAEVLAGFGLFTALRKHYPVADFVHFFNNASEQVLNNTAFTIGIKDTDLLRFEQVRQQTADRIRYVCIDVANGYSERFVQFVARFRDAHPDLVIMAGNVVSAEMTEELILKGADVVKIGIGPGSVCTTRIKTGVGYPQLSAIIECADAAHGLGGHIIGDGGCRNPGDVAKAFGGGADFVMLGGMFAGHTEGGGEPILKRDPATGGEKEFRQFYGMSSSAAMNAHFGQVDRHRTSEGRVVEIPFRGPVTATVLDVLGGLRSACTYVGAIQLKHLSKCTTFIRTQKQFNEVFVPHSVSQS